MWLPSIHQLLLAAFIGLMAWTAVSDALTFTIPNRISLAVLGLYPAWVVAAWPTIDPVGGALTGAVVLVVGFAAFALGWLGGGDVKLLAALALWAGPEHTVELLAVTALAGGLLAAGIVGVSCARRWAAFVPGIPIAVGEGGSRPVMPYGIAIAFGGGYLALALFWHP